MLTAALGSKKERDINDLRMLQHGSAHEKTMRIGVCGVARKLKYDVHRHLCGVMHAEIWVKYDRHQEIKWARLKIPNCTQLGR